MKKRDNEKKAVVIFSGGQDSTTCLHWALNRFSEVEAITFNYGQKHSIELEQAKKICEKTGVRQTVIDISFLNTIVESALTSNGDVNVLNKLGLPDSFVPNRNQIFITLAHSYAQKIGATILVGGMCQTDYSGYPDCRHGFIQELNSVTNEGSGLLTHGLLDRPVLHENYISVKTPLMWLTKAETFALAEAENCLQQVVEDSHTCYNGVREIMHEWGMGCGECPACELRKKGFEEFINDKEVKAEVVRKNNILNVKKFG
jgi:7-cyano-7-deazaguanine synthase